MEGKPSTSQQIPSLFNYNRPPPIQLCHDADKENLTPRLSLALTALFQNSGDPRGCKSRAKEQFRTLRLTLVLPHTTRLKQECRRQKGGTGVARTPGWEAGMKGRSPKGLKDKFYGNFFFTTDSVSSQPILA